MPYSSLSGMVMETKLLDAIIIGSGFGGSVHACRLAQSGFKVVVLERGRRWKPEEYPRDLGDAWVYDIDEPQRQNGWIDFRFFDDMWVAQGAGVGGGSLIYANVFIDAKEQIFESGWPSDINYKTLKPYYAKAEQMINPEKIPENQLTPRYKLMQEAAKKTGAADRFEKLDLAISFDPNGKFPDELPDPEVAEKTFINKYGRKQGYCIHAGNCDIGCKAQAKNTLDLNYLAVAETHGAEIKPLSYVSHIVQEGDQYAVIYFDIANRKKIEKTIRAKRVILSAGSLGSTEILFRSRDKFKTLPNISKALGENWSSNGDFLTPAIYENRKLSPTFGPTITAAIDYLDGSDANAQYFVEDGGFPDVIGNFLKARRKSKRGFSLIDFIFARVIKWQYDGDIFENMMPWFGQAIDGGDGRLYYGRDFLRPWKKRLKLDWDPKRSERGINGLINAHKRLSEATDGKPMVPRIWTVLRNLVTPHPLGGCGMAAAPAKGVVNSQGEVFGYPGLYVSDGSIFPRPIGLNPSKTITALAERNVELLLKDMRK